MEVGTILTELATADPERPIITCAGRSVARAELEASANRLARTYREYGVHPGDLVVLSLPNGVEFFEACHAIWKVGAVPVPISPRLADRERQQLVDLADPRFVVGVSEGEAGGRPSLPADFDPGPGDASPLPPPPPAEMWKISTSGGSTGRPKLIVPAQTSTIQPGVGALLRMSPDQMQLVAGPLYHAAPFNWSMYGSFLGHHLVVLPRFDPFAALEAIEQHRVQWMCTVPTMLQRMCRVIDTGTRPYDLSSLEVVWHMAAPCPAWVKERWIELVGGDVLLELYGTTEGLAMTSISGTEWLERRGSVGRPFKGEVKIIGDDGSDAPTGTVGEIYMRKPTGAPSYRYIGAEARALGEWESLGDMGWMDGEGYLYLTDRRADMILVGGANVYPAEIEAALLEHPAVGSCVVVGLPDDDLGQRLHAVVQLDTAVEEDELRFFLKDRLGKNKWPRTYRFVDEPLRDDAGKVRRSAVREREMGAGAG